MPYRGGPGYSGAQRDMLQEGTKAVVVLSGKGGVGKSSVATGIAISLSEEGKKVGILDVDLCGPSVARILGLEGKEVREGSGGFMPDRRVDVELLCCSCCSVQITVIWVQVSCSIFR